MPADRETEQHEPTTPSSEAKGTGARESGGAPHSPESPLDDAAERSVEDQRIEHMLEHTIDVPALASAVEQQQAADAADTLERLEEEEAVEILEQMDPAAAAETLAEMLPPLAVTLIHDLADERPAFAGEVLDLMAPDDAADLVQGVDEAYREILLGAVTPERAALLRKLTEYDRESAGGLMTTDFIALRAGMRIAQAIEAIRQRQLPEGVQLLPVIDASGRLVGTIGLRDLLLGAPDDRIAAHMSQTVRVVRVGMDREEVARAFDRYDHAMLPVVDDQDRLQGIVTVDDVIDIIRAEQTEDVQLTVGASAGEAIYTGLLEKFRGRFPWLGVSLVLTCGAALVVLFFEDLIRQRPILAFLMPVIAALVGNAGHQALAVTLRGIVLEEMRKDLVWPLVLREACVGMMSGVMLGAFIWIGVTLLSNWVDSATWQIGLMAGLATVIAMSVGTLAGSSVPLVMRRVGVDPAHASAIFLIMITDAVSFSVLLGLTFTMATGLN